VILCVGAASRRVVEEAARLGVHQVVASRRQAGEFAPGYTGYTSETLAETVHKLSGGVTSVVRDHGGPHQNGNFTDDDWTAALDADLDAGFDGLHLDVCHLPSEQQAAELTRLCMRYSGRTAVEVGGERNSGFRLRWLLEVALKVCQPYAAVAAFGGNIRADRQCGSLIPPAEAADVIEFYSGAYGVHAKAHNFDWLTARGGYAGDEALYNVAPEFGNVEIDAWLHLLTHGDGQEILNFAYGTGSWERWFHESQGTRFERARAALRYHLNAPEVARVLDKYDDAYVRAVIRDALLAG
jgi:hypothetical protein